MSRCAEGLSDHPYCTACGPFERWRRTREHTEEEDAGGVGGGIYRGAEGDSLGEKASQEDINWGENKEAEAQAGCKVGTVAHRLLHCRATNIQEGKEKARDRVREDLKRRPWDPLYWRGVPAVPQGAGPPQFEEHGWGECTESDRMAQGKAYTDGACRGFWRKTRRAGWGACVVDEEGRIRWGIYGTCPDCYASSIRAELWGMLSLLRYAVPPLSIGVDNAEVVRGWESGRVFCCNPKREGADLWRGIWDILGDLGQEGVSVYKVKAHLSVERVQDGSSTLRDWRGNAAADRMAVKGAMLAERKAPREAGDAHLKRALRFYKWAVEAVADWHEDTDRSKAGRGVAAIEGEGGAQEERRKRPPEIPVHPVSPHCWWQRLRGGPGGGAPLQEVRTGHGLEGQPEASHEVGVPRFGHRESAKVGRGGHEGAGRFQLQCRSLEAQGLPTDRRKRKSGGGLGGGSAEEAEGERRARLDEDPPAFGLK